MTPFASGLPGAYGVTRRMPWWNATFGYPAATTSRKNARRRRCEPAYTVTHASPRGSGAPRGDKVRQLKRSTGGLLRRDGRVFWTTSAARAQMTLHRQSQPQLAV